MLIAVLNFLSQAQIYTFQRSNQLKKFRIDPGKQRRAIEEAEKSLKEHEKQMEENIEKTRSKEEALSHFPIKQGRVK